MAIQSKPPDLPKPVDQKQVVKAILVKQKSQTSKPVLMKINSKRSNKSRQNEPPPPVESIEPKIILSQRVENPKESPSPEMAKPLPFNNTIVDSMNDRDEDTDRQSPTNVK